MENTLAKDILLGLLIACLVVVVGVAIGFLIGGLTEAGSKGSLLIGIGISDIVTLGMLIIGFFPPLSRQERYQAQMRHLAGSKG